MLLRWRALALGVVAALASADTSCSADLDAPQDGRLALLQVQAARRVPVPPAPLEASLAAPARDTKSVIDEYIAATKVPILTVDTRRPELVLPMPGVPGRAYLNLGANATWRSWRGRAEAYADALRRYFGNDPDRLVILADGEDVLAAGCDDSELLSNYERTVAASDGPKVVFSASVRQFPPLQLDQDDHYTGFVGRAHCVQRAFGVKDSAYWEHTDIHACRSMVKWGGRPCSPQHDRLNAGMVIGPAGAIQKVFEGALALPREATMFWEFKDTRFEWNDQKALQLYMFSHSQEITLDYSGILFQPLNFMHPWKYGRDDRDMFQILDGEVVNNVVGQRQCFVHANSRGNKFMQPFLDKLR